MKGEVNFKQLGNQYKSIEKGQKARGVSRKVRKNVKREVFVAQNHRGSGKGGIVSKIMKGRISLVHPPEMGVGGESK